MVIRLLFIALKFCRWLDFSLVFGSEFIDKLIKCSDEILKRGFGRLRDQLALLIKRTSKDTAHACRKWRNRHTDISARRNGTQSINRTVATAGVNGDKP